jgi:HAD superfamily hydrolase (TIGR01509 family)
MDGTLVDSEKVWDVALKALARHAGGELSEAARAAMVGSNMPTSMRLLREDLGQPDRDEEADAAWLEDMVAAEFARGLVWRPGAMELLHGVRAAGMTIGLVTSTRRKLVEIALGTLGRENFDVVVCGDEVTANKPDPAPYLIAADLLGVKITDCVAIEDSPTGLAAALASGAAVLAVPAELELPPTSGAHIRDSLTGVDLDFLSALLDRAV